MAVPLQEQTADTCEHPGVPSVQTSVDSAEDSWHDVILMLQLSEIKERISLILWGGDKLRPVIG